jgi:hypothetical protein
MMAEVPPPSAAVAAAAAAADSAPTLQEETAERKPYFSLVPVEVRCEPMYFSLASPCVQSVVASLGTSGRVKYSCLDVSASVLAFGANTGSLYFFDRGNG